MLAGSSDRLLRSPRISWVMANDLSGAPTPSTAAPQRPPAVLFCEAGPAALTVASLTTLDRLIVAVHRAGCSSIQVVCPGTLPRLRRAPALQIPFRVVSEPPRLEHPVFLASDRLLLTTSDVRSLVNGQARLTFDGRPASAGMAPRCSGSLAADLTGVKTSPAQGVVAEVRDVETAEAATRALWASLGSASDGTVDRYFNRPVGRFLSKVLIHTPVTPNQISIVATLLGLAAAVLFAAGTRTSAIWGAILLQISAIVDCVDGDVARVVFKESPLGKWLDIVGDQLVHIGVFVAIGVGLWRAGVDAPVLMLAASAGVGVICSFLVILRTMLKPALQGNSKLQRLIDATTNRDFSVLLLILSLVDRLVWFLWMAGIGVHVFWLTALALQWSGSRSRRPGDRLPAQA